MASENKRGLLVGTVVPLLVLTVAAAGGGALIGLQIVSAVRASATPGAPPSVAAAQSSTAAVKEMNPIVANLASPEGTWVRLQTAIVYDKSDSAPIDVTAAKIGDDVLAFMKTLTAAQLQGAAGLQHLREDLNERAALRSDGRVRELVIEMLVVK